MSTKKKDALTLTGLLAEVRLLAEQISDVRHGGPNQHYRFTDILLSAFALFFLQSPSFLAFQRKMDRRLGRSNAESLFGIRSIPSDNHIRAVLDALPETTLRPMFTRVLQLLSETGVIERMRKREGRLLIVLDGSEYYRSQRIGCERCSVAKTASGEKSYTHAILSPALMDREQGLLFPLAPEPIQRQEGSGKGDSEGAAAKRWLAVNGPLLSALEATLIADDLYANEELCRLFTDTHLEYLLVAKPASHRYLYEELSGFERSGDIEHSSSRTREAGRGVLREYRWCNGVAIRDSADALEVSWCEITERLEGAEKPRYHNAFISSQSIDRENVERLVAQARGRWTIENRGFNTMKNHGYHLEHNYGHGKRNLSAVFATLNLFAFLLHSILDLADEQVHALRSALGSRIEFFTAFDMLTRFQFFSSWADLIGFMFERLELPLPRAPSTG